MVNKQKAGLMGLGIMGGIRRPVGPSAPSKLPRPGTMPGLTPPGLSSPTRPGGRPGGLMRLKRFI